MKTERLCKTDGSYPDRQPQTDKRAAIAPVSAFDKRGRKGEGLTRLLRNISFSSRCLFSSPELELASVVVFTKFLIRATNFFASVLFVSQTGISEPQTNFPKPSVSKQNQSPCGITTGFSSDRNYSAFTEKEILEETY
jgi:hypothetical protein